MNWLTPLTGAILAAVLIPPLIILYFLKLRRRPKPIACTLLWKRAVEDLHANAPFQRLRRSLLLFLQLLALLLLVFSVMQPQIQAAGHKGGRLVLLIDNSASMAATDAEDGSTRLEEAKRRAKERIESLYEGGLFAGSPGETMIVAFSDRAEPASGFSTSKQELLSAIDRIRPTHGETRIDEAVKLARAYTANPVDESGEARPIGDPPTLEIYSDGRIADIGDQVVRGGAMMFHRVGTAEADNVTIAAIDVKRPYDRPTAVEVFAALLNFNQAEITCDVQLSVDDTALAVEEITLPPAVIDEGSGALLPGRNNVVFTPFEQPRGAVIEIANLREDDLMADNVAREVVPPPKRLKVALVEPKSGRITDVLEGLSLRGIEILTADDYIELAERGGLDTYDVIIFDDFAPEEGQMPPGRYLTFGATPPLDGLNDFGETDRQIVLNIRDEHAALRYVSLDNLYIARCRLIQPADDVKVIAEGSQGPVIVSIARGPMQVLHVTFDPLQSNWPLLSSWVTFIFNSVEYLGQIGEGLTTQGFSVGEALTTRLPATAEDIELNVPNGVTHPLTPSDPTRLSWGPIRLGGLYLLNWKTPGSDSEEIQTRAFAVNLLSETEGWIATAENLEVGQDTLSGKSSRGETYTPLWPYAVMFCLAVLMFEWWVYHRKAFI